MSKLAIKVENLSKAYQLGEIGTGTISRDLERWWARVRGKEDPFLKIGEVNDRSKKGESDIVWMPLALAVRGVEPELLSREAETRSHLFLRSPKGQAQAGELRFVREEIAQVSIAGPQGCAEEPVSLFLRHHLLALLQSPGAQVSLCFVLGKEPKIAQREPVVAGFQGTSADVH